ncbi:hypothetical protein EJ07DRAFT_158861 [Lizonia empirigonia]|nr:hypothetical protein EJ07DRAFT_158861 [Lizonia empirigonia]
MSTTAPLLTRQSTSSDSSEPVELAYSPTFPTQPEPPFNCIGQQSQPDIYFHLSQVLEWEIWTHSQTRAKLASECMRSAELAEQVNRLSSELVQLRKSQYSDAGASASSSRSFKQQRKTPEPWQYQPISTMADDTAMENSNRPSTDLAAASSLFLPSSTPVALAEHKSYRRQN